MLATSVYLYQNIQNPSGISAKSQRNLSRVSAVLQQNLWGVLAKSQWNISRISAESQRNLNRILAESQWNLSGTSVEFQRNLSRISTKSQQNLSGVTAESQQKFCGISAQSLHKLSRNWTELQHNLSWTKLTFRIIAYILEVIFQKCAVSNLHFSWWQIMLFSGQSGILIHDRINIFRDRTYWKIISISYQMH